MLQLPLNLEPRTSHTEPPTPNPEPRTLHPEPRTLHPEPRTLHPEPGTLNPVLEFIHHPRARRYVIRITDDGVVRVTVPRRGSKREAAAFAAREHAWIEKQLRARAERELRERERRTTNHASGANDERPPSADEQRALRLRAKKELPARLLVLAEQHGLRVTRVSIRNQRWRWGSCSRQGHICLNWRLVTMPEHVRDYVLIHELMHLKRLDHSPKFWKLVAEACPEYQAARRWLRTALKP
jgi:predicted metal-dependent hydrolase